MIEPEEIRSRQRRLLEAAHARGLEAVVAVGRSFYERPGAVAWLTNHFPPFPTSAFQPGIAGLGHAFLILSYQGARLIVDSPNWRDDLVIADEVEVSSDPGTALLGALRTLKPLHSGLADGELMPLPVWQAVQSLAVEWQPLDDLMWDLRRSKTGAEQDALRQAAAVADAGLTAALERVVPGATEAEVCAAGTAAALAAGADFVRYLRVHSGPWSGWSSRWPQATGRTLERGDWVVLDIIGAVEGYAFDVLRTTVAGHATGRQREIVAAIRAATDAAIALATPGQEVRALVEEAHDALRERGFEEPGAFVGHGIGLETVEPPFLRADQAAVLVDGEVLCIEPGLWHQPWGGASLEQEVIVGATPEVITPTPIPLG